MSGPNRTFSFNQGDDHAVRLGGRRDVSPVRSGENAAHHSQYSDISPVSESPPAVYANFRGQGDDDNLNAPPPPPPHGGSGWQSGQDGRDWGHGLGYTQSMRTTSTVTPGMDNLGPAAVGGGIGGIALGIANTRDRQSGLDALRTLDGTGNDGFTGPAERNYNTAVSDNPYIPAPPDVGGYGSSETLRPRDSYGSNVPLGAAPASTGQLTPGQSSPHIPGSDPSHRNLLEPHAGPYQGVTALSDGPYQRQSVYSSGDNPLEINPEEIADDGDDGFYPPPQHRSGNALPAAAGGAATGGILGALGGMMKGPKAATTAEPSYGPVPGVGLESGEKGRLLRRQSGGNKKRGLIVGIILGVIVVGAIVGGAVGGILGSRGSGKSSSSASTNSASGDQKTNGDLDKDSPEIKALMNNQNLHKVFPGMDYTPWGVQYPLCLKYPPSQNNVTRDIAVLSQLTNNVRLYGTDCNQTEMVLHAIDRLGLTDMKLWLGVWLDTNDTTNERQVKQLYKVIDETKDTSIFNGAIVGNEALFRAGPDITTARAHLMDYMKSVKANFTERKLDLPVATSDLGDNWDATLAHAADIVMSNVHPFFAGVSVDAAAGWTWTFWQDHDVALTKGTNKKQIISEVGWPTGGGNNCGSNNACSNPTAGSVAGIDELNKFMSDWVCQALENGTDYFWFEAFDEPWKVQYNEPGKEWEDKWGLMDAARKLKPGVKIPDCNGRTAS